ncbi:MAG: carboxymuconolactone decarboxylase family protein [Gemmatimonadales bacterium]
MSDFVLHTEQTAAPAGAEALGRAKAAFGFAPNLIRVLADAPAAAHGYLDVGGRFGASSLSPIEQQTVLIATSVANGCEYCVAAHSAGATRAGIGPADLEALRGGNEVPTARLAALAAFTREVVWERGRVAPATLEAFLQAGYTRANVLEVVLGVAMKTLSNYTNHVAETPLDAAFAAFEWTSAADAVAK